MVKKCWQAFDVEHVRLQLLEMPSSQKVVQHILSMQPEVQMKTILLTVQGIYIYVVEMAHHGEIPTK